MVKSPGRKSSPAAVSSFKIVQYEYELLCARCGYRLTVQLDSVQLVDTALPWVLIAEYAPFAGRMPTPTTGSSCC